MVFRGVIYRFVVSCIMWVAILGFVLLGFWRFLLQFAVCFESVWFV